MPGILASAFTRRLFKDDALIILQQLIGFTTIIGALV